MRRALLPFQTVWLLLVLLAMGDGWIDGPLVAQEGTLPAKRIVFIAGGPSHDYGSHEHYAGCRLLADTIHQAAPHIRCEIVKNGWPADESVFEGADAIVIYADGGGGHPANSHLERMSQLMAAKVGLVCLHYGVEVPKGEIGDRFLEWLGGYFETHWSVNPHWKANFTALPAHPIASGVQPFQAQDEWYFHMRFREGMEGVTPILSAIAPSSTMDRTDGPHSGNPDVRRSVARGEPQHVAWAYERANGGRSFGFTGGHFHWNWGRPEVRRLVSNAIIWASGSEVPGSGIKADALSVERLQENQDEAVPANFSRESIQSTFQVPLGAAKPAATGAKVASRKLVETPLLTTATPGHRMQLEANLQGVKRLFLVVTDGGDGFSCDWVDWLKPTLHKKGETKPLTSLDWKQATAAWGQVRKQANASGGRLQVQGKVYDDGIGTHANSVIEFELPEGYDKLTVEGALDDGGAQQNNGGTTSVTLAIYAESIPSQLFSSVDQSAQRTPEQAVAGLDIAPGLVATLAASEPTLKSLTNLDIDERGRVWVCEVVNYRRHNGERPEGDRILILEDTDQDGIMDQTKVFYQGRDIDSAMGICLLGDRILVSAAPYVIAFTDANHDDVPDSKEMILTKTGQPQHDHSNHSFVFGPDGKLYWNFGNTGHAIFDSQGAAVLDRAKRPINDSGSPYRQGMAFRCNLDLSDMEVLGHNFRNNYELAVDSFGTVWQSDNDDDGNRATRINYVMEGGNFGYVDEFTGEGWQSERIGWEPEIPDRHWHLRDPGVVPNLILTGAGSPTGILCYEGNLLPKAYWNQVIHCDAGPNVVRAYPRKVDGAGYRAEVMNLAEGKRDKWFRPADVCVAPDGSLYVTDWYDPGVGGHNMEDMERGRLFRIAPPNTTYRVPKFDFQTPEGILEALASPAHSVRSKAWLAAFAKGDAIVPGLDRLIEKGDTVLQARALWLKGKIRRDRDTVQQALRSQEPNLRMVGVRLARQLGQEPSSWLEAIDGEKDLGVLREWALSLREDVSAEMPQVWSRLAKRYDGSDRWYLEALGIGASQRWAECMEVWLGEVGKSWTQPARSDLVWRARCPEAADRLVQLLLDPSNSALQQERWLRGLEFQAPADRAKAFQVLHDQVLQKDDPRLDRVLVESAMRMKERSKDPRLESRVKRYVAALKDDPSQLKYLRKLQVTGMGARLRELVLLWGPSNQGVQAMTMALEQEGPQALFEKMDRDPSDAEVKTLAATLALCDGPKAVEAMETILLHPKAESQTKIDVSLGLARSLDGQKRLMELAKGQKLPGEAKVMVGPILRLVKDQAIREGAMELFPERKSAQSNLPPVSELVKRRGDVERGKGLFAGKATCSQCHIVQQQGKNVGPDLSEIGTKLSREAMYVSILEPSAGISHNFEAYVAVQDDGEVITGLLISQSEEKVVLRDAKGIDRELIRNDLERFEKSEVSLMPANLEQTLDEQGLVDLVDYLMSLKKP